MHDETGRGTSPPHLWAEALNNANYTRYRCLTSALNGEIPYSVWEGRPFTVSHMGVFGAKVFVLDKSQNRGKLESRLSPRIFVGYAAVAKAYRIYNPRDRGITVTRNVKFTNSTGFNNEYKEILEEVEEEIVIEIEPEEELEEKQPGGRAIKRGATQTWVGMVSPSKRGRERLKISRTGCVGRPRKIYNTVPAGSGEDDNTADEGEEERAEADEDPMSKIEDDMFANQTVTGNPTT